MKTKYQAPVLVLGDNIDTDQIYPGRFLDLSDPKEVGGHCFAGIDEKISGTFQEGGIVVAGRNFGCGSSREHAPIALLNMGASLVVADSFARIFFRNAINLGLPAIVCKGLSKKVENGDILEADLEQGTMTIQRTGEILPAEKLGEKALEILEAGGIKQMMKSLYVSDHSGQQV